MKKILLAILAVLLLAAFAVGYASAQTQPAAPAAEHGRAAQQAGQSGTTQVLTEASKEAGGDENAEFKQSASVKLLARLTGLSLGAAYWLAVLFNFAIVAGVIVWFGRRNLPNFFRSRTASIQQQIEEARRASADAQRRLADVQARLSRLDEEIAGLQSSAEKEAQAEQERIRAAAEEDRQRIVETAKAEIEAARRQAQGSLKAFAADLAVGLAARSLSIDAATDKQLVHSFVEELAEERK